MRIRNPKGRPDWRVPAGLILLGSMLAWPGVGAADARCTVKPQNPTVDVGGTIKWSASLNDIRSRGRAYDWEVQGGTPSSSTNSSPSAKYNQAGTFETKLEVKDRRREAECKTMVTVRSGDTQAPAVSITAPAAGSTETAAKTIIINATASDNTGVSRIEFYDGTALEGTDASSPFSYAWSITNADNGAHSWSARAYDAADNVGVSDSVTVTVNVNITDVQPPPGDLPGPVDQEYNGDLLGRDHGTHVVLGANDLGMHCADQDDSIFSVLPPFNVLHAQVIQRGGKPLILDDTQVQVTYSAASNPDDPVGPDSINSTSANYPIGAITGLDVYKGNFWDENPLTTNPHGYDTFEPLFFGLLSPGSVIMDLGLPAPETTLLTVCLPAPLGTGASDGSDCAFEQQAMPGFSDPYYANEAQPMHFDRDTGFFADLLGSSNSIPGVVGQPLGGVINNVNWFRADGIPILPIDDSGRGNAYPLVRVMAKQGGVALASTDVVLPVAAEADCQNCHVDPSDCDTAAQGGAPVDPANCIGAAVDPDVFDVQYITDGDTPGETVEQNLLNAAKINILRLHDAKHPEFPNGDLINLDGTRNVVCAGCHYSPALDLAQVGPQLAQVGNISMSRAMHGHHGELKDQDTGEPLFPDMRQPNDPLRSPTDQQDILNQTCYQCHPGKRTQCLRGAMGGAGIVCQDCHGNMAQVGNDFTGEDLADKGRSSGPRVSWASEPKCQSCHTGDAVNPNHPAGAILADDGIRLLQAYPTSEHSSAGGDALPILSPSSRFAENETLYRLSGNDDGSGKGHGGVMCEGCHGSTHAIWPNANPNANDNVAANQLQGHAGTISECSTCHITSQLSSRTQDGPHGMHLVNDSRFWKEAHKDAAKAQNGQPGGGTCGACHGSDHLGTVLSRTPVTRTWNVESRNRTVEAGQPVGCNHCHSLSKSFGD